MSQKVVMRVNKIGYRKSTPKPNGCFVYEADN